MESEIAGIWKRIGGGGLDIMVIAIISEIFISLFRVDTGVGLSFPSMTGLPFFALSLVVLAYYIAMEAATGKTIGKMVVGTKVVRIDGSQIGWKESTIRNVLRIVDGFFFYLVTVLVIVSTKDKQRFGDMVARTLVVNEK